MRTSRYLLFAVCTLVTAAALGPATPADAQAPGATAPIKIGVLAELTGPLNTYARDIVDGAQLYLEEINRQMAGRRVELITEDYETKPDLALTKARKLVERDRVHALVGVILASAAFPLKEYVTAQKVPFIISGFAVAEALTMEKPSPYLFRITYSAAMVPSAMAKWAYQNLGARTAAVVGTDSVGQIEVMMAFARAFEEAGGKVLQETYTALGTMDFGPYISKLRRDADVYGLQVTGIDAVRFIKQLEEYGLRGKMKLVDLAVSFTDISILPAVGPAALGAYNVQPYFFTLENPTNRRFAPAFRARYGRDPGAPAEATYAAMNAIDQAVKATRGNIEDTTAFLEALRKVEVDAPRGRIRFDRFQNSITNVHIGKIEKVGDRLSPVIVGAFPGMDQFLGMDPNEYLKRPRLIMLKGTFGKP